MSSRPRLAGFAILAVFGLGLGLVATELALRMLPRPERKAHVLGDSTRHHRLRPGWEGVAQGHAYRVNALGLRGREVATPKPAGVVRILALGDSFTEGGGLADADTVPRRIEAALAPHCSGVEVVNGGIASYSPILEYLLLREIGPGLRPDVVLLNLDMTDVHDDLIRTALAELEADGLPRRVANDRRRETALLLPPALPRSLRRIDDGLNGLLLWQEVRKSAAGRRMFGALNLDEPALTARGLLGDPRYDRLAITREREGEGEREAWMLTARYLAAIQRLAGELGARFVVATYPYPHQVAPHESPDGRARFGIGPGLYASDRPFRTLEAIGRRHGFPVITVHEAFRRHTDPARPLHRRDDVHHTADGARVMADTVAAALREATLVPGCRR